MDQFMIARVKRDILERSYIGAMFVNRQAATSSTEQGTTAERE
jgi:hypothetical protein